MQDKFTKNTLYVLIGILLLIIILVQPYNLFCKISGNCHPITFSSISFHQSGNQKLTINFSAITDDDLKNIVQFFPQEKSVKVRNGKNITNFYIAKNLTKKPVIIRAELILEPHTANQYLERIECLCFKLQPLNSEEEKPMPVSFRINPAIEKDDRFANLKEVKVSYKISLE